MSCQEVRNQLDDYVDGTLDLPVRRNVERHLEDCADCRSERDSLRDLLQAAASLAPRVDPPRNLLPGIRRAALNRTAEVVRPRFGASRLAWAGAALAAGLLVAVWLIPGGDGGGAPALPGLSEATMAEAPVLPAGWVPADGFRAAEQEYVQATEMLLASLEEQRGQLSPEARAVLDTNLEIIDRAIDEIHQAMAESPDDAIHGQTLTAMYRQKLDILWRVSRLSAS